MKVEPGVYVSASERTFDVLDHGYVKLVDFMPQGEWQSEESLEDGMLYAPGDQAIVDAARVSYANGTKRKRQDKGLLKYLLKHDHMTPFEMVQFKFEVKLPLFVARQWMRHRSFSYNEVSGRYSEISDEFYVPETWRVQDEKNKQGSHGSLSDDAAVAASAEYVLAAQNSFQTYRALIQAGVARELARMVLPQSVYTTFVFSCDLRNLLNFLRLRIDSHAQWEIQRYAIAIRELIAPIVPETVKLFDASLKASQSASTVSALSELDVSKRFGLAIGKDDRGLFYSGSCELFGAFRIRFTVDTATGAIRYRSFVEDSNGRLVASASGKDCQSALASLLQIELSVGGGSLLFGRALGFDDAAMSWLT